ncbi:hypothetical protein SJI00_21340 [Pseudomonas sp. RP23018S]|uniref:hypothetical protein n=1 Tax=Pseudomonas sp. RP23018S TaxID=3096037 RepID=UPI002ACA9956|nr:hypothetical protein [Pseudomonas sp. RP23018S]MDZ5605323.1 hypothetical protein [Pseudomonas sp. RP23018S]
MLDLDGYTLASVLDYAEAKAELADIVNALESPGPLALEAALEKVMGCARALADQVLAVRERQASGAASGSQNLPKDNATDGERYTAGLVFVASGSLDPDGHEVETNTPYYFGHSVIQAFEAGAHWQARRDIETV